MTLAVQWTADSVRSTYALASVPEIAGRPGALAALWALCVATASDPGAAATVGQAFALCLAQHHTGMTCAGDAGSLVRNSEYWRNLPVEEHSELSCTATHLTTTIAYLSRVLRAVYLSGVLDLGTSALDSLGIPTGFGSSFQHRRRMLKTHTFSPREFSVKSKRFSSPLAAAPLEASLPPDAQPRLLLRHVHLPAEQSHVLSRSRPLFIFWVVYIQAPRPRG